MADCSKDFGRKFLVSADFESAKQEYERLAAEVKKMEAGLSGLQAPMTIQQGLTQAADRELAEGIEYVKRSLGVAEQGQREAIERWADDHFTQGEVAVVMRLYDEFGWRP